MQNRQTALTDLLTFRAPIERLVDALKQFPWDSETGLVLLTPEHIQNVVLRYLNGELTGQQLEDWANAIESREDISFASAHENVLADAIFQLANPTLTTPITKKSVQDLITRLKQP